MKADPGPHDIQIEDWPPLRAEELVTPVDHERFKKRPGSVGEASDAEGEPTQAVPPKA
jgi:hypothetical protein